MGLTHLSFYKDNNIKASTLSKKIDIPYFRANKLVNGRCFLLIDEYKKLVDTPDMEYYLSMKRDFELHDNRKIIIEDTGNFKVVFYSRFHNVTAFNASYDILWRAECLTKEDAQRIWDSHKLNM